MGSHQMFCVSCIGVVLMFVTGTEGVTEAKVRCDDNSVIYIDGVRVAETRGYTDRWISQITDEAQLVAVDCENYSYGDPGGLLASFGNGVASDSTWRCSGENESGWYDLEFDDSGWSRAYEVQSNPTTAESYWGEDENFSADAKWIWRDEDFTVQDHSYCRRWFNLRTTTMEPVPVTITSIEPRFGPQSGGTNLVIQLEDRDLTQQPVVKVGDMECTNVTWTSTKVGATTPKLQDTSFIGKPLDVSINSPDGAYAVWEEVFVYKDDPTIHNISSLEALAIGGIRLTVIGQNLDSVFKPIMSIRKEIKDGQTMLEKEEYTSACTDVKEPSMVCPTPRVDFPVEFLESTEIGDKSLDFYLGFILDGVDDYRDLRESPVDDLAQIDIIPQPPIIYEWGSVKEHESGDSVEIQGKDLTVGCTVDDYTVTVGSGKCTELTLFDNALTCYPPKDEPPKWLNTSKDDAHKVDVHVGNFQAYVGLLEYTGEDWYDDPLILGGIGAAAFILLLIVVVIAFVCCRRRQNKKRAAKAQAKQPDDDAAYIGPTGTRPRVVKKASAPSPPIPSPASIEDYDDTAVPASGPGGPDAEAGVDDGYLDPMDTSEQPRGPDDSYLQVE